MPFILKNSTIEDPCLINFFKFIIKQPLIRLLKLPLSKYTYVTNNIPQHTFKLILKKHLFERGNLTDFELNVLSIFNIILFINFA